MGHVIFFKNLFESVPDYNKNDVGLLIECGFLINGSLRLCKELKKFLFQQNEDYLDFL